MSTITFSEAAGTLVDLNQKLGSENGGQILAGLKRYLRGENPFEVATWESRDGLIYITLPPSDGTTGPGWIERLKAKGFRLSENAVAVLKSKAFKPTTGIVHRLVVLPAKFFSDSERITRTIRAEGQKRGWKELNPEAVCILRESFSDEELEKMGLLWIVGVHEPVEVDGNPRFLNASRRGVGRWLVTFWARPGGGWGVSGAFAWSFSQENKS